MFVMPAHAKVNLCLAVRGHRPDGFHDIDSVALRIDWHDLVGLRLEPSAATRIRLRVTGEDGMAPPGDTNLAARAAQAVAAMAGPFDIDVWLDKRVPGAAGLGSGSGDAAAVLRGCFALLAAGGSWSTSAPFHDGAAMRQLASSLGSDVPMLLVGGAQRMRGRGELLSTVAAATALHLVVAVVGASSTAATYAAVRSSDFEDESRADAVAAALEAGVRPGDDLLGSGLEAAACRANPALGEGLAALRASLPMVRWHLTGSGGAAFAVAGSAADARELAIAARDAGCAARACRTVGG
jgi:4-diphosphocytidyl-2-C-methyl-D-erythritol kinase